MKVFKLGPLLFVGSVPFRERDLCGDFLNLDKVLSK